MNVSNQYPKMKARPGKSFMKKNGRPTISKPSLSPVLLVSLLLFLPKSPVDARILLNFFSYTTMMGLAAQSSRWKTEMNSELTKAAEKSSQSTYFQEAGTQDQFAADELIQKSQTEQEAANVLQEQADGLYAKAEADQTKAVTAEEESQALFSQSSESQAQSASLFVQAAAEEVAADEDTARGAADAAIAAKYTAEAEADEATTGFCQVIPLADVVCDVVGGVAAVSLEAQSSRYALMAAQSFAEATAAQATADSTGAEASELAASAVEEGEEATALQSESALFRAKAAEEMETAQADETAANDERAQSALDKTAAGEEETKSLAEEEESANSWQESTHHGANACAYALIVTFTSVLTTLYFGIRLVIRIVLPVISSTIGYLWSVVCCPLPMDSGRRSISYKTHDILLGCSHLFHHCLLLVLAFGLWGEALLQLRQLSSIKAMGGTVLGFAISVATTQIIVLYTPSRLIQQKGTSFCSYLWGGCSEFARRMLILFPFVVMETLLVWVNTGRWVFQPEVVEKAQSNWLCDLLVVSLISHHLCFARFCRRSYEGEDATSTEGNCGMSEKIVDAVAVTEPLVTKGGPVDQYGSVDITLPEAEDETERTDSDDSWEPIYPVDPESESVGLLNSEMLNDKEPSATSKTESEGFIATLREDFRRFRLASIFELLMASILLALLLQSTPLLQMLWPASKPILVAAYPHWRLICSFSAVGFLILLLCACL